MNEFEQWIRTELELSLTEATKAFVDDWTWRWIIGDGTGEPRGILNQAGIEIYEQPWTVRRGVWAQW